MGDFDNVEPEAVLGFSTVVMTPLIAGIVQAFIRSGLPVKHAALTCLVLGVALSVAVSASTEGILVVGLVRGAVVGLAAFGAWAHFSTEVDTNGDSSPDPEV